MKTLSHINTLGNLSNSSIRIGLTIIGVVAAVICLLTFLHDIGATGNVSSLSEFVSIPSVKSSSLLPKVENGFQFVSSLIQ